MENKIELLKKLGFSDNYLKFVTDETKNNETEFNQFDQFTLNVISFDVTEITYPIVEKTEAPINSYVN